MLGKHDGQVDIFNSMIYDRLVPKDHLLVRIDEVVDFSFIYSLVEDSYSEIGRKSKDPVIMYKLCVLGYIYRLSDPQVVLRAQTDIAFRWFLRLELDDIIPDDSTISRFRTERLGDKGIDELFKGIVQQCIEKDLIKTHRYMIDSTDVAANVNYPSTKKLLCNAFRKVIKEVEKHNAVFAEASLKAFETEIEVAMKSAEEFSTVALCKIAYKYVEEMYLEFYELLREDEKSQDAFVTLWRIIEQYSVPGSTDRIISCVDPDARVANKTNTQKKKGYKDHIIVDEDSEIIIASEQTAFNVPDCKKFESLIEKAGEMGLKPKEISADKAYGTMDNRAYAKDNEITTNILFYEKPKTEYDKYDIKLFNIAEDLKSAVCPNGCMSIESKLSKNGKLVKLNFAKELCNGCPLREQCLSKYAFTRGYGRTIEVAFRYDGFVRDMERNKTPEFEKAYNRRYIIERRFATMVRNHGLRRCRYLRLKGAKIHITLANTVCNIIRMVNLLSDKNHPSVAMG